MQFRYSTDAAYLDTGWFVDDVMVNGAAATVSSDEGEWFETSGLQDNNWTLQVVATCDLTPGVTNAFELTDGAGNYVYRLTGDQITQSGFNTKCANGKNRDFATLVSNLPTGDLTFLDAGYDLRVQTTATASSQALIKRRCNTKARVSDHPGLRRAVRDAFSRRGSPSTPPDGRPARQDPAPEERPADAWCSRPSGSAAPARSSPARGSRRCEARSTRSATWSMTARSWLMNSDANPNSRCRSANSSSTRACTDTSSALVGSSAMSSFGLSASARASEARWRCPPDSSCGNRSPNETGRRTASSSSFTRWRAACVERARLWTMIGSAMHSAMVSSGLKLVAGSWKTNPMSGRSFDQVARLPPAQLLAEHGERPAEHLGEPHHGAADRRLARAGLADEADDLAGADPEVDALHRDDPR